MAICVFVTSKQQREFLAKSVLAINVMQVLIGLFLLATGVLVIKDPTNIFSEKAEVTFVFTVVSMYGVTIMFQYLIGMKICYKCRRQCHKKSTGNLFLIWAISACNCIVSGTILASLSVRISKHIVRVMRQSLTRGMSKYLSNMTWKFAIDRLQQDIRCCGVDSYVDWLTNEWISMDYYKVEFLKNQTSPYIPPVLPWSCCRVDYSMACYHDRLQQSTLQDLFAQNENIVLESIYKNGCLSALRFPVETGLLVFILADVVLILLQITNIILLRLLFTSSTNAILLGDGDGVAPAVIFSNNLNRILQERSLEKIKLQIMQRANATVEEGEVSDTRERGGWNVRHKKHLKRSRRKSRQKYRSTSVESDSD